MIYVDAHATGNVHDGTSWAKAYTNLQDALAKAASKTTLSGDIGTSSLTDNSYTVVTVGTGVAASLQNLTVSGGYNDANGSGGGLKALKANALTLSSMTITNDFASNFGGEFTLRTQFPQSLEQPIYQQFCAQPSCLPFVF